MERKDRIGDAGRKAEKIALRELGADPVPASGASDHARGDGELPGYLVEVKSTVLNSFMIKRETFFKHMARAESLGLTPAVELVFTDRGGNPQRDASWIAIPDYAFKELIDGE